MTYENCDGKGVEYVIKSEPDKEIAELKAVLDYLKCDHEYWASTVIEGAHCIKCGRYYEPKDKKVESEDK